jgi:serine protease
VTQDNRRHAARRPLLAAAVALAFASPLATPLASPPIAANAAPTDYNQFIVKFKDGSIEHANASQRQQRLDAVGRAQGLRIDQLRRLAVGADVIRTDRVLDARQIKNFISKLRNDPRVEYAEVDTRVKAHLTPDDTRYTEQWHYYDAIGGINAPSAWDLTTGSGQVVAVLDTGITAHPDLDANIVAGYDFITDTTAANDGGGRDSDPSDPGDWCGGDPSSWHGTHVAGTVAAVTNNALGVAGVAFGAKVQPVRVLGTCGGSLSDINDAIVWASGGTVVGVPANATPAKVINLSLGGGGSCGASTQAAVNTAVANGATVVVSAGNSNSDASGFTPASCANVITVGATGPTGARASYSNYGASVEIAAPGGDGGGLAAVLSTLNDGATTPGSASYAGYNGTSMAAPHIAGVAALVQAAAPTPLTPADLLTVLQNTSRDFPVACPLGCGTGIVDATAAVIAVSDGAFLTISEPAAAMEGDSGTQVYAFTVNLSQALATDVSFDIATSDVTATAGSDYVANSTLGMEIPAGETTATFNVTVNGDTTTESDETFLVTMSNVVGDASLLDDTAVGTITNDDMTTLVNGVPITGLADAVVDHENFYKMVVPAGATNLSFAISGGTGDADIYVRYGAIPTEATWECRPWSTGNNETCNMTAQAGTWYVMIDAYTAYTGVSLVGSYTPPPNDTSVSIGDATVTEGNSGSKLITFTATLANVSTKTVTFDLATADGTATAGSDYTAKSLTGLNIPIGQLSRTFNVFISGDSAVEDDETILVNLTNAINADVTDAQGVGTITNDDGPTLSIADAGFQEGNSGTKTLNFTVSLSQASIYPVTFNIATVNGMATAGSDFVAKSLVGETIPAGELTKTFSITTNGDTTVEGNETLFVQLSNASVPVTDGQARGMLVNDDGATLSISDATVSEGDSGTKLMTFTVSLSQAAPAKVTFNFSTAANTASAGSDFDPITVTGLTIPYGQLSKTVSVVIRGDMVVEADETLRGNISMGNVSILDGVGIGTITNDD